MKVIDLSGSIYGSLTVLRKDIQKTNEEQRGHYWCRCACCGEEKLISSSIIIGRKGILPKSCGCMKKAGYTHPKSRPDKKYETRLLHYAWRNSRRRGETCTLTVDDIPPIPTHCPVLGIPLVPGGKGGKSVDNSPSVDRIDSRKGYEVGNIWIVSQRANRIKSDATLSELKLLVEALEKVTG